MVKYNVKLGDPIQCSACVYILSLGGVTREGNPCVVKRSVVFQMYAALNFAYNMTQFMHTNPHFFTKG